MTDAIPPSLPDIEEAVVGAALLDKECAAMVAAGGAELYSHPDITAVVRAIDYCHTEHGIIDANRILADGSTDVHGIRLLESQLPNTQVALITKGSDLAGKEQGRDRIVIGAADPRDHVGGPRTAGADGHPQIPGHPGIAVGRHGPGLFVLGTDEVYTGPVCDGMD